MIVAKVAKINDKYRLIINKGLKDGVEKDMKFYVYDEGDEITDPDTGEILQNEEIIKAWLKVIHAQEKIAILETTETKTVIMDSTHNSILRAFQPLQMKNTRKVIRPLNVEKDDLSKTNDSNQNNEIDKRRPIKVGDFVKHAGIE